MYCIIVNGKRKSLNQDSSRNLSRYTIDRIQFIFLREQY